MGGYDHNSAYMLYKLLLFVGGSIVFSIIFWGTYHKMIVCDKTTKKRKK